MENCKLATIEVAPRSWQYCNELTLKQLRLEAEYLPLYCWLPFSLNKVQTLSRLFSFSNWLRWTLVFGCPALIHYIKGSHLNTLNTQAALHNELKEVLQPGTGKRSPRAALGCGSGMETEATQRGYLFRRAVPLQVPTKRLRGQIRIGRQPAWAFAVIMHSKRITSRFFPIGWDWLLGKIQDFDFEVIRPTRCHGKLQTCHHRSGSPQLTVL